MLNELGSKLLVEPPGFHRITWLDLVEQVAIDYDVAASMLLRDGSDRTRGWASNMARAHVWGALVGSGASYREIAATWRVSLKTVYHWVLRIEDRLHLSAVAHPTSEAPRRRKTGRRLAITTEDVVAALSGASGCHAQAARELDVCVRTVANYLRRAGYDAESVRARWPITGRYSALRRSRGRPTNVVGRCSSCGERGHNIRSCGR